MGLNSCSHHRFFEPGVSSSFSPSDTSYSLATELVLSKLSPLGSAVETENFRTFLHKASICGSNRSGSGKKGLIWRKISLFSLLIWMLRSGLLWSSRLSSMSPLEPVSLSSFSSGGSEDFSRSSEDLINLSGGKGFKESLGTVESSLGETSTSVKENI